MMRSVFRARSVSVLVLASVGLLAACGSSSEVAAQTAPAATAGTGSDAMSAGASGSEHSMSATAGGVTAGASMPGEATNDAASAASSMAADAMSCDASMTTSGHATADGPLTAAASLAALRKAGWTAKPVTGMPHTASGVAQVGYLELTSPCGAEIDVQFLATPADAAKELTAAAKSMPGLHGTVINNALVFSRGDGMVMISTKTLAALRPLLR